MPPNWWRRVGAMDNELLKDTQQLRQLVERQVELIASLRTRLAVATDLLIEHGLLEEYLRRVEEAECGDHQNV